MNAHNTTTLHGQENLINKIAAALGNTILLSHLLCVMRIKDRFGMERGGVLGMLSTENLYRCNCMLSIDNEKSEKV